MARLLTAVAAVGGPEPGGTVELDARLIQALQGGMQQVLRAELAPIGRQLGSIDARLTESTQIAEFTRTQLQRWTIRYESTSGTPRLFTLTPVTKEGLSKAAVWQDRYQLTLWCEHDDKPHPWPPARYRFTRPRDWLLPAPPSPPPAPLTQAKPSRPSSPRAQSCALRALLSELDPKRTFNGMHVVATTSDVRWVCQEHYREYNPGLPSGPA